MNKIKYTLTLSLFLSLSLAAQRTSVWGTYSQAKFVYSPGLEAAYFITPHLGINLGSAIYYQDPDNTIINYRHTEKVSFLCANLGLCSNIYQWDDQKVGAILGAKVYYGPDFQKLTYYEEGGYHVYFDQSHYYPEYGVDMGLFYAYKRLTVLAKFDTARQNFRFGIGYQLGKLRSKTVKKEQL